MFDPHRAVVVANPMARGGFVGKRWTSLSAQLQRSLGPVTLRLTRSPGDAARLSRDAIAGGVQTLISFGGDGTHGEVVDGIMRSNTKGGVALGILHAGTGGDFRRMIPGADDLETACAIVRDGAPVPIDVGWVRYRSNDGHDEDRHFVNIASMGLAGLVDRLVARSRRKLGGKVDYATAVLRANWSYEPARIDLRIDGNDEGEHEISNLCVCNGRWAGGGMMFAPEARVADGLLDVIVIRATSTLRGLPLLAGLYRGTHLRSTLVRSFRGREVEVSMLDRIAWMDVDGEPAGVGPATFRILRGALRVIGIGPGFM